MLKCTKYLLLVERSDQPAAEVWMTCQSRNAIKRVLDALSPVDLGVHLPVHRIASSDYIRSWTFQGSDLVVKVSLITRGGEVA